MTTQSTDSTKRRYLVTPQSLAVLPPNGNLLRVRVEHFAIALIDQGYQPQELAAELDELLLNLSLNGSPKEWPNYSHYTTLLHSLKLALNKCSIEPWVIDKGYLRTITIK